MAEFSITPKAGISEISFFSKAELVFQREASLLHK
jgi:hypothetical protein